MIFKPHDYQSYCIEYIKTHPIAALLLDMGLGKTAITLTAIRDLMLDTCEVNKVLVIAPLRVARDTWPTEVEIIRSPSAPASLGWLDPWHGSSAARSGCSP